MSRIRADQLVNRAGSGGPKFPHGVAEGFSVSGVVTATSYRGDGSQLTGIDASSLKDGSNVKVQATATGATVTGDISATNATFSGNLTVNGTTTTIDTAVTAVDSLAVEGNVGIGITNPTSPLTVKEVSNVAIELLKTTNESILTLGEDGSSGGNINAPNGALLLSQGGTERLRISSDGKVVISRFDDGSAGPYLELYNNSESPANNDYTGSINFKNNNSASEEILYAEIRGISRDITDGSEDGEIQFYTERNGSFGERVRICADQGTNFNESRLDIIGGNTNVANVDEINGSLRFRSNDASVNSTENVGAQISAVTEASNGAYVGMSFYTFEQGGRGLAESLRIASSGHILPGADNTQDLGSSSKRFANIYTGDLNLSNEGSANDVDGTWGQYTIQEGEDDLFLINRRTGKKYKFNLTEVD